MNQLQNSISSLEVAEMVGREHKNVLQDIRGVIAHLGKLKVQPSSYFTESTYINSQNKTMPCFLLTKQGCELYGNRMTGIEGTAFSVKYIERFNEMEQQQKPKSQLEIMQMQIEQMIKQERELQELKEKTAVLEEKQDNIFSILSLNNDDWRNKVNQIINAIAMKLGGMQYYKDIRKESYQLLEQRAGCLLDRRLENRQSKMALRGQSKTTISKINKLDVIAEDKKLISVYITVIKEMAVKYQLDINKYELENGDMV